MNIGQVCLTIKQTGQTVNGILENHQIKMSYRDKAGNRMQRIENKRKIVTVDEIILPKNMEEIVEINGMGGLWYIGRDMHSLIEI